jgi:hypothetical protein
MALLGLVVGLCGCTTTHRLAAARPAHARAPAGFVPEALSAVNERDFWVLGTGACRCSVIVRTTDGGRTFAKTGAPPVPVEGTVPSLEFTDLRNGFAYVPGWNGVLYATHDGGATWHRQALRDVLAVATSGKNAYAVTARCRRQGCTGYRLETAAVSSAAWATTALPFAPDGGLVSLAARGSKLWLLGTPAGSTHPHDQLARSLDSGRTFTTRPGPCYSDLGGQLSPASATVVWAVCPTGMSGAALRSADGGIKFSPLTAAPPLVNSAQLAPASATTAVVFGNGAGSRLFRTTDGGASWKRAGVPRTPIDVWWLGFTDARVGFALVQTGPKRQALWRTTDGGADWSELRIR